MNSLVVIGPHRANPVHLFMLEWLQNPTLTRRVSAGLNKGEAKNALARAVFLIAWASCVTAASKTSVIERADSTSRVLQSSPGTRLPRRAVASLSVPGKEIGTDLLAHLSPLGWEQINLAGDYLWHSNRRFTQGRFRPLRTSGQQTCWS